MLKFRKSQPCPHPETCPVPTPNGICEGDCGTKILVEYYILKHKYNQLQIQNGKLFEKISDLVDSKRNDDCG